MDLKEDIYFSTLSEKIEAETTSFHSHEEAFPKLANRKKREENSKKYAVSFKSLGYVFNREEANNFC